MEKPTVAELAQAVYDLSSASSRRLAVESRIKVAGNTVAMALYPALEAHGEVEIPTRSFPRRYRAEFNHIRVNHAPVKHGSGWFGSISNVDEWKDFAADLPEIVRQLAPELENDGSEELLALQLEALARVIPKPDDAQKPLVIPT